MSGYLRIKICGIKTLADALAAVEAGADMLGFNFYPPSPRCISIETGQAICTALRKSARAVTLVGVFVNPSLVQLEETFAACQLDLVQLSGAEAPGLLEAFPGRAFKGLRPASASELTSLLCAYPTPTATPAWLIDAYHPQAYGGTGQTADWSLAAGLARQAPILLAGGLTPENAAQAASQVKPWGLDVASGVESEPGVKDHQKISAFIRAARSAAETSSSPARQASIS